ncbi:NAD(P)/FAD-dependent oxidoreductase [Actinoplanes sp. NPDC051411]|uniref:FAD-dependent oxidoreductase n=1 Tax=Actinoplanes sp. NPDC051411 TaxID=3155522 RepID=UPI003436C4C3
MRVAVAGAGVGGLGLAQGLRRAGIKVRVFERSAGRPQGYRLHFDARAGQALEKCLPPALFELVLATAGQPGRAFSVLSRRLRPRHRVESDPAAFSTSVDRGILREILSRGLDGAISYDSEVTGFDADADGVTVRLAGGGRFRADVLVGADGVHSAVRRSLLPSAPVEDTGSRVIYGKTLLDDPVRAHLPPALRDGFVAIVGGHVGLATGLVEFRHPPAEFGLRPAADYLMWGLSARRDRFPPLDDLTPAGLHAVALRTIRFWHRDVRALLAAAAADETFLVRVRSSVRVPAWPPSRVTLLGDAIHAMSPAGGSGANIALMDAANLTAALAGAGSEVVTAIEAYERSMRDYGFAAVEASRRP